MPRVETIRARLRTRKGTAQVLPERPVRLRPGDRSEIVKQAGRVSIVIYRAPWWKRTWMTLRGHG